MPPEGWPSAMQVGGGGGGAVGVDVPQTRLTVTTFANSKPPMGAWLPQPAQPKLPGGVDDEERYELNSTSPILGFAAPIANGL